MRKILGTHNNRGELFIQEFVCETDNRQLSETEFTAHFQATLLYNKLLETDSGNTALGHDVLN